MRGCGGDFTESYRPFWTAMRRPKFGYPQGFQICALFTGGMFFLIKTLAHFTGGWTEQLVSIFLRICNPHRWISSFCGDSKEHSAYWSPRPSSLWCHFGKRAWSQQTTGLIKGFFTAQWCLFFLGMKFSHYCPFRGGITSNTFSWD